MKRPTEEQPPRSPAIHLAKATDDVEETIRWRAYQLYEQRGSVDGLDLEDWLQAEAEVLDAQRMPKAA